MGWNTPDDCPWSSDLDYYSTKDLGPEEVDVYDIPENDVWVGPPNTVREGNLYLDGGDVDNNERWIGPEVGCLACNEVSPLRMSFTCRHLVYELTCGKCLEAILRVDTL